MRGTLKHRVEIVPDLTGVTNDHGSEMCCTKCTGNYGRGDTWFEDSPSIEHARSVKVLKSGLRRSPPRIRGTSNKQPQAHGPGETEGIVALGHVQ